MTPPINRRRRPAPAAPPDPHDLPVAELPLQVRTINALEAASIILVRTLLAQSVEQLVAAGNFGEAAFRELCQALKTCHLKPPWGLRAFRRAQRERKAQRPL